MKEDIKIAINELTEQSKKYPKMWTVDVIKLLNSFLIDKPKEKPIYKEDWNPDWKGDPDDPLRWKGW